MARSIAALLGLVLVLSPLAAALPASAAPQPAATERLIVELGRAPTGVARAKAEAAGVAFSVPAYDAALLAEQDRFLAALAARGISATVATAARETAAGAVSSAPLRWTYTYNGLAIDVPAGSAPLIASLAGVRHVQGDEPVQAFLSESVPYIGAPDAWSSGYRGEGQTIADIDTGIDWTHPMFTDNPALPPGDLHPKVKYYLCLTAGACTDDFGHGTHVGGIAAGDRSLGYLQSTPAGIEIEQGKALFDGVAPKALLWGYKVLSTTGSGVTTSIVTAIDDAARKGAKVINLSLGSTNDDPNSANSKSVDNAMKSGTLVAVAAGNSGPGYSTIGTPATAKLALTVGATTDPGDNKYYAFDVTASPQRKMNIILMSNSPVPPTPAIEKPYVFVGEGCTPADYATKAPVTGLIALIARGTCTFTAKAVLAQTQGAVAALIYNNVAGDFSGSMEKTQIPVAGLSDVNGAWLRGFTGTNGLSTHVVRLDPQPEVISGQITGFSSRGPTKDYRIKPDVVAPGNTITSATSKVGVPTQSMANPSGYTTAGGTSMATPHVAGVAAILRQAHPDWSTFDVRLAMMNTATQLIDPADGKLYSVQDQGAGLVNVPRALGTKGFLSVSRPDLGANATEGSYSFGEVENTGGIVTRTTTFTLRDVSGTARSYQVAFEPGDGKGRGGWGRALPAAGFSAALSAASVSVPANGSATFTLTVTANGGQLADGDYEGRIVASAPDQTLRAPIFYRSIHRATAAFGAPVLSDPPDSTTGSITLDWTAVAGAVGYRLQEGRTAGTPVFSDDAESGLGKWTVGGPAGPLAWSTSTQRAKSPTKSFATLQGPAQNNTLTLKSPINVPAGSGATLSFATWLDTEPTFDFGYVEASRDGTSWSTLAAYDGNSGGWVSKSVDLSSFAGGDLYVRFRYESDDVFDAVLFEGWYVDDISIALSDWKTVAEPAGTTHTLTGRAAGTYYYRVAGLFDTATATRAEGPWSNVVEVVVRLSDLAISADDISASQTKNVSTISAKVRNIGTSDASNVLVRFFWDGVAFADRTIASVPAGGSATVSAPKDVRHQKGPHTVTVTVDPDNTITEIREDNNSASKTVTVKGNRVRNGSFEDDDDRDGKPDGWKSKGKAEHHDDDRGATDGKRTVSVTGTGTPGGSWTSEPISVSAGETLSLSVDLRSTGASSAASLVVDLLGTGGLVQSTLDLASGATGTLAGSLTIPAGVTQITITLNGFAPTDLAPQGTVKFDNVLVY